MVGLRGRCGTLVAIVSVAAPIPTPIGSGPKYRLPAAAPAVERAEPVAGLACRRGAVRELAHLELFADKRVLVLPAGIGMSPPLRRQGAYITRARCSYAVRTTDPTGVVEFVASARPTLATLFAVWGQALTPDRLAGFRGRVSAWVGGRRWRGPVTAIPLTLHAEIVVELGGYIPPHTFFLFS